MWIMVRDCIYHSPTGWIMVIPVLISNQQCYRIALRTQLVDPRDLNSTSSCGAHCVLRSPQQ